MIFRLVTREENIPNVWLVSLMCSMFLCGFENSEFNICSDFSHAKPVRLTLLRKERNRKLFLRCLMGCGSPNHACRRAKDISRELMQVLSVTR